MGGVASRNSTSKLITITESLAAIPETTERGASLYANITFGVIMLVAVSFS